MLPIERPQKIICVGLNYRDHAEESGTSPPERPIEIVAFASEAITLEPGDLIATGTPAGVGFARTPPVWLRPGDEVTVEIDGIGALTNPVVKAGS